MEQIIRQYGRFLVEALVLVLLLILLLGMTDADGNRGVLEITGSRLDVGGVDYTSYTDYDAVLLDGAKDPPVLTYNGGSGIHAGASRITDYIHAVDCSGSPLEVKVTDVLAQDGSHLAWEADTSVTYPRAGVYTVTVYAVDAICKKTVCTFEIPVNP